MGLIKIATLGALGYAGYKYMTGQKHHSHAAFADNQPAPVPTSSTTPVRDAGATSMRDAPKSWSKTDEAIDQSFPASDPATNY